MRGKYNNLIVKTVFTLGTAMGISCVYGQLAPAEINDYCNSSYYSSQYCNSDYYTNGVYYNPPPYYYQPYYFQNDYYDFPNDAVIQSGNVSGNGFYINGRTVIENEGGIEGGRVVVPWNAP